MNIVALDPEADTPLVTQIESQLRTLVDQRVLNAGARLPSIRALARQCRVSTATVVDAYNRLVAAGYLEARHGSGYSVALRAPTRRQVALRSRTPMLIDSVRALMRAYDESPMQLHVGCGWLPESWLDDAGVKLGLRTVARSAGPQLVRYGNPLGYLPLRQQIQISLAARGIEATPEQIVTTAGASEALQLAMKVLVKSGDTVICDDPAYSNLILLLKHYGLTVIGVPRTPSGPDVAAMERLVTARRPKVFFTSPTFQNPTGTSYGPAAAFRVLQLAEQHDFMIVEDDIFAELRDPPSQTLAALDQLHRVIYIQSYSKSISPSLRVGYLAADAELAEPLISLKTLHSLATSELSERMVFAILTGGGHRKHVQRLRDRLARAQEEVADSLQSAGMRIFHRADGGMFLWAAFDGSVDPAKVLLRAADEGIVLAPGRLYSVDGLPSPWYRFNVAHSNDPRLYRFLEGVPRKEASP